MLLTGATCSLVTPSAVALLVMASLFSSSALRKDFRFCFFAPTGNRLVAPQAQHFTTATSAQGLRPPLLRFSVDRMQVSPSTRGELHTLQNECFRSFERRICAFCATDRRCAVSCSGSPEDGGLNVAVLGWPFDGLLFAVACDALMASVPGGSIVDSLVLALSRVEG